MNQYVRRGEIADALKGQAAAGLVSLEAEQELIGLALQRPERCEEAFEQLAADKFGDPVHARVWAAISGLSRQRMAVSPALVRDRLGIDEGFEVWGGIAKLEILQEMASPYGLAENIAAVADRATRRALRDLTADVGARVLDTAANDGAALITDLERGAAEIARTGTFRDTFRDMGAVVRDALAQARAFDGRIRYPFGVPEVDQLTNGLHARELTIGAAWTGMGKTVGGQTVARACASAGLGTLVFSLEMDDKPMGIRLACDVAYDRTRVSHFNVTTNITLDRVNKNLLERWEWERLDRANDIVDAWPLKIDTRPGLTVAQIEATARRAHRRWEAAGVEPGPVIVDHIGKVRPAKHRGGDKTAEMTDVSNELAEMAKNLGVPVLGLCQLNRKVDEQGEDKRPQLSHLKQSSAIAEDARQVIFFYRPEYYYRKPMEHESIEKKMERETKLTEVRHQFYWIVEKNSHGPRDQVLSFCEIACSAIRPWNP